MAIVAKEMTVDELRALIKPAEDMDNVSFDPSGGEGEFIGVPREVVREGQSPTIARFKLGDRQYGLKREAYEHFASLVGIPSAYTRKIPIDLMVPHLNYRLHAPDGPKELGFGAIEGTIQTFGKGQMNPYSNYRVLDVVERVMGPRPKVYHVANTLSETTYSFITDEEHTIEEAKDAIRARRSDADSGHLTDWKHGLDILHTGVTLTNSYAQSKAPEVAAYVRRLSCMNGACSTDNVFTLRHRPTGDGSEFDDWLADALEQAIVAGKTEIDRVRELTARTLDFGEGNTHLSETMDSIFAEFSVPNNMRKRITDAIVNQGIQSMYDVYNIITDVASNSEEALADPRLMRRLQRVGGEIAMHPETCQGCHRILP